MFVRHLAHLLNNVEVRCLNTYLSSPLAAPDFAVCDPGFAPGISYGCRKCSGGTTRLAVGLAVAMALALFLLAGLLFSYLWNTVHGGTEEDMEIGRRSWQNKFRLF